MKLIAITLLLCTGSSLLGDIIYLKDGTKLEGDVKRSDDGWDVFINGKPTHVPLNQLKSIELTGAPVSPERAAADRLASLRRSADNLNDLSQIIVRYQKFIEQTTDVAALADAKKDLQLWQDRASQNRVKVAGKWVTTDERAQLIDAANLSADQARQLMKQGRTTEAEPLLNDAIANDPQNATALYLLGLLRYQQEQILSARKAFDAVAALVPNHAPTLNNLAVIQYRQRQYPIALTNFDGAMLADPVNKEILDNVAGALDSLPNEYRDGALAQKVTRHFQEQDTQLAERMAASGWHRVGTVWVTDRDLDTIHKQEKETQEKLDAMATDFDKSKDRITQLDRDIQDTESQLHRMEAQSYIRDPASGVLIRVPYPAVYSDLQRDDQRLQEDRAKEQAKMDSLQESARDLQKRLPTQKKVEVQRMIGPEGTPARFVQATMTPVTTRPATQSNGG